jgi:hypothetical protein
LDKAAFYKVFGGQLVDIQGKYPENDFVVNIPKWVSWYESIGGWVPYNHFCNVRRELKRKSRKRSGLPAYFTGSRPDSFKLGDIATARPWSKRELERIHEKEKHTMS